MKTLLDRLTDCGPGIEPAGTPGVLRLTVRGSGPRRTQERVIDILADLLPVAFLWLPSQDSDLLARLEGATLASVPPSAPSWTSLSDVRANWRAGVLDRGGWGLFLAQANSLLETPPGQLAFAPEDVRQLTKSVGARVGIVSWYDDNEWLISVQDGI